MSDILPGKLGKHSVYVWGAVLGVGILAYMWYMRRSGNSTATTADATTQGDPTLGSGALGSNDGSVDNSGAGTNAGGTVGGSTGGDTGGDTTDNTPTNQTWEAQAVAYLHSIGVGAETAQKAVEMYLNGYKTSYQQHLLLNKVIAKFGVAPDGTASIPTWGAAPKPKPKPVAHSTGKPKPKKKGHKKIHHKRKPPKKRKKITVGRRFQKGKR